MKQRIRVVGIIRSKEGVLILKRSRGRSDRPVFWELLTEKIKFGEQPEEAIARSLSENLKLSATSIKIKDVITFLALEDASRLSNLYIVYEIEISDSKKPNPTGRYTAYKFVKDFSTLGGIRLSEASLSVLEIENSKVIPGQNAARETANSAVVHVDGASRGNPGPSGIGYCIYDSAGEVIEQGGEFIGFATSRVAEYYAMRNGIEKAKARGLTSVRMISDSLMVVNQLNGIFKPKNQDIIPIFNNIEEIIKDFESISFTFVPRSENVIADREANKAIDSILG